LSKALAISSTGGGVRQPRCGRVPQSEAQVMEIIPVIDLMEGQVVRGVGGRRSEYRPIVSRLVAGAEPAAIAEALTRHFHPAAVYVADLDAIIRGAPDYGAWQAIANRGLALWLDAGIGTAAAAAAVLAEARRRGIGLRLVIGLESLANERELAALAAASAGPRALFSLDLKAGRPLARCPELASLAPLEVARRATAAGFSDLIVLDLADVGTGGGTSTLALCRQIRQELECDLLVAGGGVRSVADLAALAKAGCDAAMVASALHDGTLSAADCEFARTRLPAARQLRSRR